MLLQQALYLPSHTSSPKCPFYKQCNSHMVHLIFQKVFYNLGREKLHNNFSNFRWPGCEQSILFKCKWWYTIWSINIYLFSEWEKVLHSIRSGPFLGVDVIDGECLHCSVCQRVNYEKCLYSSRVFPLTRFRRWGKRIYGRLQGGLKGA